MSKNPTFPTAAGPYLMIRGAAEAIDVRFRICCMKRRARKPSPIQTRYEAGLVTVPGKPGDEMAVGTLNNILKQAGFSKVANLTGGNRPAVPRASRSTRSGPYRPLWSLRRRGTT